MSPIEEPVAGQVGLEVETLNPRVLKAEYAVRGEIVARAQHIQRDLEEGKGSYQFDKVVMCNIGNPQILGQKPITYFRQVLSLCEYPELLDHPATPTIFPADVIARARHIQSKIPGGIGAYSDSQGARVLREMIAASIQRRDGHPCSPDDLYMTDGASPAVHFLMLMLLRGERDAFMVPIPQYPLYSATLALYGGRLVPYLLDESKGWGLDMGHLREQLRSARQEGLTVRGMVVINPGNPTGQCLTQENQRDILAFCRQEGLALVADEVYQSNIYTANKSFASFKKVYCEMGEEASGVALFSLHSTSKGFVGECGRRGGYMEVVGAPQAVREQILKLASINLCPNVSGQICTSLMMNPPQEEEPSYALYRSEKTAILESLRRRAVMLVEALNQLPGVSCNAAEGALYAFPRISLPPAACQEADRIGKPADWLYCQELLEATGIVVVPGSGFGQADGTFHFRTTFLPPEGDMGRVVELLGSFHRGFMAKYGAAPAGTCASNGTAAAAHEVAAATPASVTA